MVTMAPVQAFLAMRTAKQRQQCPANLPKGTQSRTIHDAPICLAAHLTLDMLLCLSLLPRLVLNMN